MKTAHIKVVFNSNRDQDLAAFQKDINDYAAACGGTVIQNCDRESTTTEFRDACKHDMMITYSDFQTCNSM